MKIYLIAAMVLMVGCSGIDCANIKTGKFKLTDSTADIEYIIERNDSTQTEKNTKTEDKSTYKIEWLSDCEYTLTLLEGRADLKEIFGNRKMLVEITAVTKHHYSFNSRIEGIDTIVSHTIKRLE